MPTDYWDKGEALERYVGRWSRLVAREFVMWLGLPDGAIWIDVGCGPGALTETILAAAAPKMVVGIHSSESYVAFAKSHIQDTRATFRVGTALALNDRDARYDGAVAGLVLNFVSADKAIAEMSRVTRPGGKVGAYVWDYADGMGLMRRFWDAAVALDPAATDLDEGQRFPICQPKLLPQRFVTS